MVKNFFTRALLVLTAIVMLSCSGNKTVQQQNVELPTIDANTETELEIWAGMLLLEH